MNEALPFNSCLQNSCYYRSWDFGHQGGRLAMEEKLNIGNKTGILPPESEMYTLYRQKGLSFLLSLSDVIALYSVLQKVGKTLVTSKVVTIVFYDWLIRMSHTIILDTWGNVTFVIVFTRLF